jgi:hypothetical protein
MPLRPVGSRESIISEGQVGRLIPALATAWCQFGWQYAIVSSKILCVQTHRGFVRIPPSPPVTCPPKSLPGAVVANNLGRVGLESADSRSKERVDDASQIAVALRQRFRLHHKLRRLPPTDHHGPCPRWKRPRRSGLNYNHFQSSGYNLTLAQYQNVNLVPTANKSDNFDASAYFNSGEILGIGDGVATLWGVFE